MTTARPSRPVLRWHGGKWLLGEWIISHFPEHRVYVEPFGGGGSILLRKAPVPNEVYNDLDDDVVNLFQILRDPEKAKELARLVSLTPFSRTEFEKAYIKVEDPLERARLLIVRCYMGFAGDAAGTPTATGFRANIRSTRQSPAGDLRTWPFNIPAVVNRLRGVIIERKDVLVIMEKFDTPETLHYVDPPYVHSTRAKRRMKAYNHEMDDKDHENLATTLHKLKGFVVISGYPSDLYAKKLYPDWEIRTKKSRTNGNQVRTEALWMNPKTSEYLKGMLI